MFLPWLLMQFSDGVMEFILSVRNVTYKIIGFVFAKAKFWFLYRGFVRINLIGDCRGVFCFDSLIKNYKLTKL